MNVCAFPASQVLPLDRGHRALEQRHGPVALEDRVGREIGVRRELVAGLRVLDVHRHLLAIPASLLRARAIVLVGQEVLD